MYVYLRHNEECVIRLSKDRLVFERNLQVFSLPRSRSLSRHATLLEERCVTRQITLALRDETKNVARETTRCL